MTEPLSVVFQRRAIREAEAIDEWWRSHRPSSPNLVASELEAMLAAAALMPTLGASARSERALGVRRLVLRNTRYHVYYRVRAQRLEVLAVWHATRGTGPGL